MSANIRQATIRNVICGENVVIYQPANLYDCTLGDNVFVGPFVEIQGHTRIGNDSKIQSHTFICEYVTIGERCFIGHGVMFANVSRCVPSRKRVVNNVTTFVVLAGFNRSVALWLKSTSLLSA